MSQIIIITLGIYVVGRLSISILRKEYEEHSIHEAHRREMRAAWLREQAEKNSHVRTHSK